jgi:hypothetical protein
MIRLSIILLLILIGCESEPKENIIMAIDNGTECGKVTVLKWVDDYYKIYNGSVYDNTLSVYEHGENLVGGAKLAPNDKSFLQIKPDSKVVIENEIDKCEIDY